MNFIILDLSLLVIFLVLSSILLYKNKKNLTKDGPLFLYKTKWGIKLIERIGTKYKKFLRKVSYVSIGTGYLLMVGIVLLIFQTLYLYITTSMAGVVKAPPIMPLIPYFPKLFGLESVFPPFYFIYFILALLIVATAHEFAHGIFARSFGIKIKSTGFAFLKYFPALFGAFVEQDDKQMIKKKTFSQMSIISAGVFANVLIGILFFILLVLSFNMGYAANGVSFDTYSYSAINVSGIDKINGENLENPNYQNILDSLDENNSYVLDIDGMEFLTSRESFESQKDYEGIIIAYHNSPAMKSGIDNIILSIDGEMITDKEKLQEVLYSYNPGNTVKITTMNNDQEKKEVDLTLEAHPENSEIPWIGIGFSDKTRSGISGKIYSAFSFFKEDHVYYEPKCPIGEFIYNFIWWVILINLAVALFNMLPVGILDGGMFFYLTLLSLTKSEKIAAKAFKFSNYLFLLVFIALMVRWVFILF